MARAGAAGAAGAGRARCRRSCYKYVKCAALAAVVVFFAQLYVALRLFPAEEEAGAAVEAGKAAAGYRAARGDVSARRLEQPLADDEDLAPGGVRAAGEARRPTPAALRPEELDFEPACEVSGREAISAIRRAKTQSCKRRIVDVTCQIRSGDFYARELPGGCPRGAAKYGLHLGCYQDEKKLRLLSSHYGNYGNSNTPQQCLDICLQAGFPYAGVQYSTECFCGENLPPISSKLEESSCSMKCPGDASQYCGGYFTMNIYETGVAKFIPQVPNTPPEGSDASVRIVFLLTLNGRALRQVRRLINTLYSAKHYFYIHVDARQDYLHRELTSLEKQFPNVKLASRRFSTIWGGASLLEMLLSAMKDIFKLKWEWDFVINLSESDFPIKSLDRLEEFLTLNRGLNFVKSHGREVQRFIKKQGLDKTFIECDTHMWRIGERKLPRGVIIDGGSDWIALSPEFVSYVVGEKDELLRGLEVIFKHTLLPAESFFHTVLRNSKFCNTYVDNNLHVTNWKRKLGCRCQYKHVVDWCGCSPNDFRAEDWPRIQSTQDRQLFFARKFEPIINQEIIARVEQYIGYTDHYEVENLEAYWQNIYHKDDLKLNSDDTVLTHAGSIVRHNANILNEELCKVTPLEIVEVTSYHYADMYKGNLILYKAKIQGDTTVLIETWYKPQKYLDVNKYSDYVDSIKTLKVGSDYDQKEQTFRNLAGVLGPLSEPSLLYYFSLQNNSPTSNLTLLWLDPAGVIADVNQMHVDENNFTDFVKANIKLPLLPGIWKVGLFEKMTLLAQTKFLVTPLQYISGKEMSHQEAGMVHGGSQASYKNYSIFGRTLKNFIPNPADKIVLQNLIEANLKRVGRDLTEWIDNLTNKFYNVLGLCIHTSNNLNLSCGKHKFELCSSTKWSSLSPDPKGTIGKLNNKTGRLNRV